jgi:hypothetical protein
MAIDYLIECLKDCRARLVRGPLPQASDEPSHTYRYRRGIFYRDLGGFIRMLEYQIYGRPVVWLTKPQEEKHGVGF